MYKEKSLVRCGDTLYYGEMSDKYVVKLFIKSQKKSLDLNIADMVTVQLISTDDKNNASERVVKISEKGSLYSAIDIADVWLRRALEKTPCAFL